jgi:hypothetical protein
MYRVFDVRLTWRPGSSKQPTGTAEIESVLNGHPGYTVERLQTYSTGDSGPGYVDEVHALLILRKDPDTEREHS